MAPRNQAELSTIFVPGLLRFGTLAKDKTSPAEVPRIYGCFFGDASLLALISRDSSDLSVFITFD